MNILSVRSGLFLVASLAAAPSAYAALACRAAPELMRAYTSNHLTARSLNDDIKKSTVELYVKGLDSSKSMLLEGDVSKIKTILNGLFDSMRMNDCSAFEQVSKILVERALENEEAARKILGPDYQLDENVEIVIDSDKRGFAKTREERDALLKKFIHFQISNLLQTDMKLPEAKKQLVHRYELVTKRLRERSKDEEISNFVDAFANALDPHSGYLSKDRLEDFQIDMRLSLEGIGASLSSQDGYTVVEEVIPGGAADRAKVLVAKDKIIAVAQDGGKPESVIDMDLRDVVRKIRGKKGTKVHLTLLRQEDGGMKNHTVAIVRDKIDLKEQAAKLTIETRKIGGKTLKLGVLELPSFYGDGEQGKRSSYADMKRLLEKANREKVDGIVLNLARNGGGLLDEAVKISGLFIKQGGVVATKQSNNNVETLADEDSSVVYTGPLVVLTSRFSASASEILAGALKDYGRAVIVGADHTFGKGTVQAVVQLSRELGAMKVTTGMFFLPGGKSTQHQGVMGDIAIPSTMNNDEIGEKALDHSLPPQEIKPFIGTDANSADPKFAWKPVDPSLVKKLAAVSKERVAKDEKLQETLKEIAEAKQNKGVVKLAEVRKKSEAEKKKDGGKAEKKVMAERIRESEAPYVNEALAILGDYVLGQRGVEPTYVPAPAIASGEKAKKTKTGSR